MSCYSATSCGQPPTPARCRLPDTLAHYPMRQAAFADDRHLLVVRYRLLESFDIETGERVGPSIELPELAGHLDVQGDLVVAGGRGWLVVNWRTGELVAGSQPPRNQTKKYPVPMRVRLARAALASPCPSVPGSSSCTTSIAAVRSASDGTDQSPGAGRGASRARVILRRDARAMSPSVVPEFTRQRYLRTDVSIEIDGAWVPSVEAVAQLPTAIFVVTAANPASRRLAEAENEARNEQLRAQLVKETSTYRRSGSHPTADGPRTAGHSPGSAPTGSPPGAGMGPGRGLRTDRHRATSARLRQPMGPVTLLMGSRAGVAPDLVDPPVALGIRGRARLPAGLRAGMAPRRCLR